ncbi:gephyrin: PROVISIONAL [Gigaspora margarita]|uniref:Gephyrin: PROVISIONAL n=1 Tax=Gigaspora margarita TaxID=4874 RepID=A0A8H4EUT0_GIGMA|nr:gephyrin: PROVISIONAL [Gigaspora margarita]
MLKQQAKNSSSLENQIIINDDNTVYVPFGHAAESYILYHSLLKSTCLKSQSCLRTPLLINQGLITLCRVKGAADFIEWEAAGNKQSTNRIDDIIKLTAKGQDYVQEIQTGVKKDNYVGCRLCLVRVMGITVNINVEGLGNVCLVAPTIEGTHLSSNIINTVVPKISRINLTHEVQDKIIISHYTDHQNTKGIKETLLVLLNSASEEELNNALLNSREICNNTKLKRFITHEDKCLKDNSRPWTILHYLIEEDLKSKGYILYYQQPNLSNLKILQNTTIN